MKTLHALQDNPSGRPGLSGWSTEAEQPKSFAETLPDQHEPALRTTRPDKVSNAPQSCNTGGQQGLLIKVYAVRYEGEIDFARNDRVRVSGTYANGVTKGATIDRL